MKTIRVSLKERSYDIIIGWDIISRLGLKLKSLVMPKDILVITNNNIRNRFATPLTKSLKKGGFSVKFFTTIDSEKAKSFSSVLKLAELLADYARQKKIAILAFGGGVVGDLAGFIASIYKRGVPVIQVPTTLLAQTDSSIGGKTAIDLSIAKNLIGTFYQPRLVFCDLSFLKSLDKRQLRAGLAEAIKYAVIRDKKLFSFIEDEYQSIFSCDHQALEHLVFGCARIKASIVAADEKEEKGLRTVLNFGHTIGHAIEVAGGYSKYTHGEAISIGMLCAAKISQKMNIMTLETYQRIANLIARIGLAQEISIIQESKILKAYKLDKKFIGKTNRFVLIKEISKPVIYENVPETIIRNAIKELFISYP